MNWMWLSSTLVLVSVLVLVGVEIDAKIQTHSSEAGSNLLSAKRG